MILQLTRLIVILLALSLTGCGGGGGGGSPGTTTGTGGTTGGGTGGGTTTPKPLPSWGTTTVLNTDSTSLKYSSDAVLAEDATGNRMAVWIQSDGATNTRLVYAQYSAASDAWTSPTEIVSGSTATKDKINMRFGTSEIYHPRLVNLAMDAAGNAWLVWNIVNGGVMASYFSADTLSWSSPQELNNDSAQPAWAINVASNDSGTAVAVWVETDADDGTAFKNPVQGIYASVFDSGTKTWGLPTKLDDGTQLTYSQYPSPYYEPEIAVDSAGNVTAVWQYLVSTGWDIESARYSEVAGWTKPVTVSDPDSLNVNLRVVLDSNDNLHLVWSDQTDSNKHKIMYSGIAAGTNDWIAPAPLDTTTLGSDAPMLAVNASGQMLLAWINHENATNYIYTSLYDPVGGTWSKSQKLTDLLFSPKHPEVMLNDKGLALVVYEDTDLFSYYYTPEDGWSTRIKMAAGSSAGSYQLLQESAGDAIGIWTNSLSSTVSTPYVNVFK